MGWTIGWAAEPVEDPWQTLLDHSPFIANAPGGEPAAGVVPLEWRGILIEANESFFSVFEISTQRARWVRLNETDQPFLVRSYDPARAELLVDYQRHALVLKLKPAKVAGLPAVAGAGTNPAGAETAAAAVAVDDDAIRLALVAQEIARRQALRRQAARAAVPAAPEPALVPSP